MKILDCQVCKILHEENVPYVPEHGCLCCQEDHHPTCQECGELGYVGEDPYSADVNNDPTPCVLCKDCAGDRADEI